MQDAVQQRRFYLSSLFLRTLLPLAGAGATLVVATRFMRGTNFQTGMAIAS